MKEIIAEEYNLKDSMQDGNEPAAIQLRAQLAYRLANDKQQAASLALAVSLTLHPGCTYRDSDGLTLRPGHNGS